MLLYLVKNFKLSAPRSAFNYLATIIVAFAAVYGFALNSYYKVSHNQAGSYENMVGRVVGASNFVRARQDSNTYFLSLTGNSAVDAQVTSLAAMSGSKVVVSYDGIFPDAYMAPLFSKSESLKSGKKFIVFINENAKIVDSINPQLPHRIEQDEKGDKFLLVNP